LRYACSFCENTVNSLGAVERREGHDVSRFCAKSGSV
jgi:hypothetical protein